MSVSDMKLAIWILTTLASIYLSVYYDNKALNLLPLILVVVPLLSFIAAYIRKAALKVRLVDKDSLFSYDKEPKIRFGIKGLPVPEPKIFTSVDYENRFTGETGKLELTIKKKGTKTSVVYSKRFNPDGCGAYFFRISSCHIQDHLGFIRLKVKFSDEPMVVTITPDLEMMNLPFIDDMENSLMYFLGSSDNFNTEKPGDDPSEVFAIREYQPGDRPRSIHWKQSVKTENLLVKEMSLPKEDNIMLIFDCTEKLQRAVELYGNISYSLAEIGFLHNICMKSGGEVLTYPVSCEEDFVQGIARFLSHKPEHFDFYIDDLGNNHKIVLDDSLTITVDGKFEYGVARSVISKKN